jgi:hypothetical protein
VIADKSEAFNFALQAFTPGSAVSFRLALTTLFTAGRRPICLRSACSTPT